MPSGVEHRVRTRPRPMLRKAEVSVVVPVFNYGMYLESCIRSVLSQDGVDIDLLILDDASTDDSLPIAEKIAAEDARVRVIAHSHNRGHIPTVNEGMAAVSGEYVVKLDADDTLTEGSLQRSVALLQAFPATGFVYGLPWVVSDSTDKGAPPSPEAARNRPRSWTVWPGREWVATRARRPHNPIMQPEAVIRLSALRTAGAYREELPHTSDFEMWMRLAARFDVGRVNGAYQGVKREHPASMSRTVNGGLLTDITERARAVDSFLDECFRFVPGADAMSDRAHRVLAREALGHAVSAYARGAADTEPVDGYIALARSIWPDADVLRDWRLVQRLRFEDKTALTRDPELRVREALRDLTNRLRWRRWKWSGT
jgi:glycosyltransferase involved in cell wall biosynthesis